MGSRTAGGLGRRWGRAVGLGIGVWVSQRTPGKHWAVGRSPRASRGCPGSLYPPFWRHALFMKRGFGV